MRLPRLWLFTDERMGAALEPALERLPGGAGIIFRHYSLPQQERRALFDAVRSCARKKGQMLLLAGSPSQARAWGADGWHGRGRGAGLHSCPVHDLREIRRAERAGAALLFLSPVFPTRSHPGGVVLRPGRFGRLARATHLPVVALGGMNEGRWPLLRRQGAYGWAAIDAWSAPEDQKRKAVPI